MRYEAIPHTDLRPATLCLGTADIGSAIDRDTSFRMLDTYREQGGNFIDSALVYANWLPGERSVSEKLIGAWLRERGCRDEMVLATKGAHPELSSMQVSRLSRDDITHDVESSLTHLQTDRIDLYWLHRDDPRRPVEDIIDSLHSLVRAGKIRYVGCSNWRVERIKAAREYAATKGWIGFVADQPLWNMAVVDASTIGDPTIVVMDEQLFRYHQETNMAAVPFSGQANGLFQYLQRGAFEKMRPGHQRMYASPENPRRYERAAQLGRETGLSITQIVLAYLQSQPFPTFPIVGPRSMEQLADTLQASEARLTPEQIRFLERGEQ